MFPLEMFAYKKLRRSMKKISEKALLQETIELIYYKKRIHF